MAVLHTQVLLYVGSGHSGVQCMGTGRVLTVLLWDRVKSRVVTVSSSPQGSANTRALKF